MPKYIVSIKEIFHQDWKVEANSEDEARAKVYLLFNDGESYKTERVLEPYYVEDTPFGDWPVREWDVNRDGSYEDA